MMARSLDSENTAERTIDVFFYGLFMDAAVLRQKGVQPRNSRAAIVAGYRIVLGEKAMLLRDSESTARGMLFRITHREMELLYSEQKDYRPEPVLAKLASGESVAALSMLHLVPPIGSSPRGDYASQYTALLRKLDLSDDSAKG